MSQALRPLHVAVLLKQVPPYDRSVPLDEHGRLARAALPGEMNAWCRRALTRAVQLAEASAGHVTALTMGPPGALDVLREALACGAHSAVHLSDPRLAGADCLVTAHALAAALRTRGPFDLVLAGHSSTDAATGALGPMVAGLLGWPFLGPVMDVDPRDHGRGLEARVQEESQTVHARVELPAVVSVAERSCRAARADPSGWPEGTRIATAGLAELPGARTAAASPTRVLGVRHARPGRRPLLIKGGTDQAGRIWELLTQRLAQAPDEPGALLLPQPPGGAVTRPYVLAVTSGTPGPSARALLGAASLIAAHGGGRVVVGCAAPDPELLASWGADLALDLTGAAPRPAADALAAWLDAAGPPHAVLGGATAWERELLARLGTRLDAGLLSDLVALRADDASGRLIGTKPVGGALADLVADGAVTVATLRTGALPLPAPRTPHRIPVLGLDAGDDPALRVLSRVPADGHDALERARVVIGVGAGVPADALTHLAPLQALLGAELAATRKVTDTGALPHNRQLGITGRAIAPRLYVAIGISGSQDHLVGVERAHTIVAINNDPSAAIFEQCDIGVVADWREAVTLLTRAAHQAAAR